jgi:ABC-type phosphate transport system substrate-binding protein
MPRNRTVALSALALALLLPAAVAAADFVVVVNSAVPVSSLSRSEASRLFLRSSTQWPNGEHVKPVDLAKGSPVRAAFTKEILGRSPGAIEQYWTQAVFSGRAVPPPEKRTDNEILSYVRETPGAIGYVSAGAATEGVKRVAITN